VAAGLGAFSLGSDTNGSIRVPSSFCGIFGLKPTFGRLPRTGSFPFVFDLDHLGAFARSPLDLALIYDLLQGWAEGDPACVERPFDSTLSRLDGAAPLRVGVLGGWFEDMADAAGLAATGLAAQALAAQDTFVLPLAESARSAAFLITAASGANLHRENLRNRPGDFDPATRGRLLAGALLPADAILQAQRIRRAFYDQAMAAFAQVDILLAPATPCQAPKLGQKTLTIAGQEMPARPNIGVLSQPISAIGLPVVTVPMAVAGGLPMGVQVIAPPWREDLALRTAQQLAASGLATAPVVDP
jgi:AtzE family amidohydrolase